LRNNTKSKLPDFAKRKKTKIEFFRKLFVFVVLQKKFAEYYFQQTNKFCKSAAEKNRISTDRKIFFFPIFVTDKKMQ
jgi:hypothetical protein